MATTTVGFTPGVSTLEEYETRFADRHLLHGVVAKWAREKPDTPAMIECDGGREITYQYFDAVSTALAIKLLDLGFRKGDFLATSLPLIVQHVFLEYACFKIGVVFAPLDLRLKGPEVVRSLELIRAKGFAFLGQTPLADFRDLGRLVQAECPFVERFLQFSPPEETIDGADSMLSIAMEVLPLVADPTTSPLWGAFQDATGQVSETDGALVIYTTGSTGYPKPALLSHRGITCQNMCVMNAFGLDRYKRGLINVPPSHVACQAAQLAGTFFDGRSGVAMTIFDPEKSLAAIEKYKVESIGQIPAMFNMQWRLPNFDQFDLSSLRVIFYGGQQATVPMIERMKQMCPVVATGLGLTEMSGFVTYSRMDAEVHELSTSVGFDQPITPLSIRKPMKADGTAGDEIPDGEIGEICFTGPQVFLGYVGDESATARTVSKEGVCYTGDLGFRDSHGLHFTGRSKLVIKPKGYQVYPAQVEEHFAALREKVAAVAAVGAPHEIYSEGIILFVERHSGVELTSSELEVHSRSIAAYMRPGHYEILEPGGFPLNRVSKTDYVLLHERALRLIEELRTQGGWDR